MQNLSRWIELCESRGYHWIAKRLSGNDTGLTGSHVSGMYLPEKFFRKCFPKIVTHERLNPKESFTEVKFPQFELKLSGVTATYYNNKHLTTNGTRDEFRLTKWEGRKSPVQDPENTGALLLLAFLDGYANIWICQNPDEEAEAEGWIGSPVEPKSPVFSWSESSEADYVETLEIPDEWRIAFPTGLQIFELAELLCQRPGPQKTPDEHLLRLRELEFKIFKNVENSHILPKISSGFLDVDSFLSLANSVTNRRKSRSGKSLELGLEHIFRSEEVLFESQPETENKKRPDFIFPSIESYHNAPTPTNNCAILAAKTCCKDRWRQVADEADKLTIKHLFTLQEGVSANQFTQMQKSGVQLVIPEPNRKSFPKEIRSKLLSLTEFISFTRKL
ncbi:MAG: type II restriction endonuclease [Verrucomicrobiales bacterium]|nr:type II restriction endonuclease [Verrucomicrobiales bacterium]